MERELASGEVRLAVEEHGSGPAVVGLHGLTATRRYVLMGSRALERAGFRVVLYDARGHGASSPAPSYGYGELADDLGNVLDELEIDRAILVGASMGAHTALRFALRNPDRVAALAIVTPAYDPASHPQDLDQWDALARGLLEDGVEGFVSAYGLDSLAPRWRATAATVLRQRLAAHEHPRAVAQALREVPRSRPFGDLDELTELRMPAAVVGSRDEADPGHPLATARAYAAAIPNARLLVEKPDASPLAWQGGRLSRIVAELTVIAGKRP